MPVPVLVLVLVLAGVAPAAATDGDRCAPAEANTEGGATRRMPLRPSVDTGLPVRPGVGGEVACAVFVEGDAVDIRCAGEAAVAVRAISGDWYSATGSPVGLLVWLAEGEATAAMFPPTVHWSELTGKVLPPRADASEARRCSVRLLVNADGTPVAARAQKECSSIESAERLAMTASFDPPCIEGGPWPVQTDVGVWVP